MKFEMIIASILATLTYQICHAQDSTAPLTRVVTPLKPKTVLNLGNCREASVISANFAIGFGKTGGGWLPAWVQSNCPSGYQPYGLKSYVGIGNGTGTFQWRYYCCQTQVIYTATS